MGTEYSMRMESLVDKLQARIAILEAERDAAVAALASLRPESHPEVEPKVYRE